jgi:hypothetical protein
MQKNLEIEISILDLIFSIPDLENSKRAFRKKNSKSAKNLPQFSSIFR